MSSQNSSLHQMRENHHKQIRRQYIQTFTKNKRKQLFQQTGNHSSNQRQNIHQSQKQKEYLNYLQSLTASTFQQDPNNHLQYILEILCSDISHHYSHKLADLLVIVHNCLMQKLFREQEKIEYLRELVKNEKLMKQNGLFTDFILSIVVYNEVFFQPLSQYKQLYFQSYNPMNPLQAPIESKPQNQQKTTERLQQLGQTKLNVYLVFQFFITITFEITPAIFIKSMRQKKSRNNNCFSNGYDELFKNGNIFQQDSQANIRNQQVNDHDSTEEIQQFINIYNDIYNIMMQLLRISSNMRYQIGSLQKLWNSLYKIYHNPSIIKSHLPTLWFDKQKMFVKDSFKTKISLRAFQVIVNMSALVQQNVEFDRFVNGLSILSQIEQIIECSGLQREEVHMVTLLYSNLVLEEIMRGSDRCEYSERELGVQRIQEQQVLSNYHILTQPPGIHSNILQLITQTAQTQQQINHLVYILKTILQHYQVPRREENQKILIDHQYRQAKNSQLILGMNYCEVMAQVVGQIFTKLSTEQLQIQHLADLFVLVCEKLLSYMLYLHQLPDILQLVIRNENKRIVSISLNNNKSSINFKQILSEKQEKHKTIIMQNLKHILKGCSDVISLFRTEMKVYNLGESPFIQVRLDYKGENVPKKLIEAILQLWQHNQIQNCYSQFVQFIYTAVECFPQYLLLLQDVEKNQKFMELLEQIGSNMQEFNLNHQFVSILQLTVKYLTEKLAKSSTQQRHSIHNYLIEFRENWHNILQHLEGLLYANSSQDRYIDTQHNQSFAQKVEIVYQSVETLLKETVDNMQVEI